MIELNIKCQRCGSGLELKESERKKRNENEPEETIDYIGVICPTCHAEYRLRLNLVDYFTHIYSDITLKSDN